MPFFTFGKKSDTTKSYSLSEIPLFSDLSSVEMKSIERKARLVEFQKGDKIYSQGDQPNAFYIIISGRLRVLQKKLDGTEEKVVNLYRNDYFGEISILTNRPHSVTVEALNDALVIRIEREDFSKILSQIPSLSLRLSRSLGRLVTERDERRAVEHAEIISLYGLRAGIGKTSLVTNLAVALKKELNREVVVVSLSQRSTDDKKTPKGYVAIEDLGVLNPAILERNTFHHPAGFDCVSVFQAAASSGQTEQRITQLLTFLLSRYRFVLVDLPLEIQELALKVLSQSDVVFLVTDCDKDNLEKCLTLTKRLKETFHYNEENVRVILSDRLEDSNVTAQQVQKTTGQRIFSHLPYVPGLKDSPSQTSTAYIIREPRSPYAKTVRYLARELGNALVGLALGSGAAFGLAHIGVLKVLEEENIPIDVIAGSSIGALLGGFWASGMSAQDMEKLALGFNPKNSFFRLIGFGDIMVPHWGIFKGNQIENFMREYLGTKTFADLNIPFRVVATNLATSEAEVFEEGEVVKAIRASCSIPGIFRAVRIGGKILVDGGIADPLPVGVLSKMGVKKIIAVNVLSGPKDHSARREAFRQRRERLSKEAERKNHWQRFWFGVNRKFLQSQVDNIFNVLMSTIQFMEYSLSASAGIGADIVINPVVIDSHWAEFYSGEKFIKVGEEKTREMLKEIKALLES